MSFRLRLVLFAVGLALATAVILNAGVSTLAAQMSGAVLPLTLVVAVYGVIYCLNGWAWHVTMIGEGARPPLWRVTAVSTAAFALNFVTPVMGFGGEPYRAAEVAPWLGRRRAVGSVVQYRLLHALGHMLFVVTALVPSAGYLPGNAKGIALLALMAGMGLPVGWWLLRRHQEGMLEALLDLALLLPLLRRAARKLEGRRPVLRAMDGQIREFYHTHPAAFWRALGIEYLSRLVAVLEFSALFLALGMGPRLLESVVVAALSSTVINLFFFLPFELGAREGGLFLIFALLGLGTENGVFVAVVTRLRELVWSVLGLLFMWAGGARPPLDDRSG